MTTILLFTSSVSIFAGNPTKEKATLQKSENKTDTCYTQTVTNYENECGVFVGSVAGPKIAVTCNPGQTEGNTTTTYKTKQMISAEPPVCTVE